MLVALIVVSSIARSAVTGGQSFLVTNRLLDDQPVFAL
jgi:hypothetical protein